MEPPPKSEFLSEEYDRSGGLGFGLAEGKGQRCDPCAGAFTSTHISDDFHQVVGCAAGVADALHSRKQVWRRVTQQHTHLVGLTSDKRGETENGDAIIISPDRLYETFV